MWPFKKKKPKATHLSMGAWGEQQATRFLKKNGYKIIDRNVRIGRHDELDIIALENKTLVFVEVKTRRNEVYGKPIDAVGYWKQRHLSRGAMLYLQQLKKKPDYARLDVIEVVGTPSTEVEIRHHPNAFKLTSPYRGSWR